MNVGTSCMPWLIFKMMQVLTVLFILGCDIMSLGSNEGACQWCVKILAFRRRLGCFVLGGRALKLQVSGGKEGQEG